MKNRYSVLVSLCLALLLIPGLSACSAFDWLGGDDGDSAPLPGQRISILELQKKLEADDPAEATGTVIVPAAWENSGWTQPGGMAGHVMQNLALNTGELRQIWRADIGSGSSKALPLTAQPVVAAGRVFTLDSEHLLSAFDASNGNRLWQKDLQVAEEEDPVLGGGISFEQGRLFVTTGYNEIVALMAGDGEILWRRKLNAPARAAPAVFRGRVFATTLNNSLVALDARDGRILWDFTGIEESTGILGAASPAVNSDIVVPAFSSGEIYALRIENGSVAWSDSLSPLTRVGGLAGLSDIRGLPVLSGGVVFAVSFGGKLAAINGRTGTRIWQRDISSAQTPWVAGDYVFVMSSDNRLVAFNRKSGSIRWIKALKRFENEQDREDPVFWAGPVMAGGRLILASSHERVVEISPENGQILRRWDSHGPISIPPLVAGKTLYLLSDDGIIAAYR